MLRLTTAGPAYHPQVRLNMMLCMDTSTVAVQERQLGYEIEGGLLGRCSPRF